MKVVINSGIGGFGLSPKAVRMYAELKKITLYPFINTIDESIPFSPLEHVEHVPVTFDDLEHKKYFSYDYTTEPPVNGEVKDNSFFLVFCIPRDDPDLIKVVEKLGSEANNDLSELKIVTIPDGIKWVVCEGEDGREWIAEKHRTWS